MEALKHYIPSSFLYHLQTLFVNFMPEIHIYPDGRGTCLNHCLVYTRIGGHAYGFVYPGPINKILKPQIEGLKKAGVDDTKKSTHIPILC